jgi:hypothetical protein
MIVRSAISLSLAIPTVLFTQEPLLQPILSKSQANTYQLQKAKWGVLELFDASDIVLVGTFKTSELTGETNFPLELHGKDVEEIVSEFNVLKVVYLRRNDNERIQSTAKILHYRYRQVPAFASKPPHLIEFEKIENVKELVFVMFLKSHGDATRFRFVAGDSFANLSVRLLSDVDEYTQLELHLKNGATDLQGVDK